MHSITPHQPAAPVAPSITPAAIAERIAAIDQRVSAIDLELLTLRERLSAVTCILQGDSAQPGALLHPVSRPIVPRD